MTDRDSPSENTDAPRPKRRRRSGPRDPARVAENKVLKALQPGAESSYVAASASPLMAALAPRTPDRTRAIALRLTAPEVVAITEKQYREAVDLLAAMIVSWVQRDSAEPSGTTKQQP
jgi:hypothetical protein